MKNVLVKENSILDGVPDVICPVELDYIYEILDPSDKKGILSAAECLSETFAGISVDGVNVSEPMTNACRLSPEDMFNFVHEYLKSAAHQRLCCVAKDKITGQVIGAIACDDFNPDEEIMVFEGSLKPMNDIISFLTELDERFINAIYTKKGKEVTTNEYVHSFMAGARLSTLKRFVIIKLLEVLIIDARARGYKGIFMEATNFRSIKLLVEYCGFHPIYDIFNNPIQSRYEDHEIFKVIPPNIATECKILYKPLSPNYDI